MSKRAVVNVAATQLLTLAAVGLDGRFKVADGIEGALEAAASWVGAIGIS